MIRAASVLGLVTVAIAICFSACSRSGGSASSGETLAAPTMPADWTVVSDVQVPAPQVQPMGADLGAELTSVRNTVYDVRGKRVQVNTIVAPDAANAEKLMTKMLTMKGEEALLLKDLTVYEFVGANDVLPEIAEGRQHLDSM